MNKMLKISLVALLAATPLMARADIGDPVATGSTPAHADTAVTAAANPGYALATESATDGQVATAGYVKGAYNAAIKAVNKVASQVATMDTSLGNAATQDGVKATINTSSATYTPQGSVGSVTITAVNEWGTDGTGTITVPGGVFTGTAATISPKVTAYTAQ